MRKLWGAAPQLCAGATNIALEASMAVALSLPGSAKLFAIKTPSTKRRLKVIGTVWQPALRKGKKIKKNASKITTLSKKRGQIYFSK